MFRSRDLALVSGFAAIYIGYGYASNVAFPRALRSLDLFFLISAMFAILAVVVAKPGAATLLGTVTGLILFGSPAPAAQHIAASLIANGLFFDLYLRATSRSNPVSRTHIITAAAIGNLVMAIVGLLTFQASGLPIASEAWPIALIGDPLIGAAGALFGLSVVRRIQTTATVASSC